MKKMFAFLMVFALLLCGCDGPVIPPSTEPPEVQIPETTVPPTTEPPLIYVGVPSLEPTEIAHPYHETLESTGFVHVLGSNNLGKQYDSLDSMMYCYIGESSVIELPLLNMTLTLPEGWLDRVYVLQSVSLNGIGSVKILNRSLMEAYEGFQLRFDTDSIETNTIVWWDYIVSIEQTHRDSVSEWTDTEWDRCVGNNDVFFYRYHIVDANSMKENSNFLVRQDLIETIGQDGYDELVGNLVVDKQMVMNMITIHENVTNLPRIVLTTRGFSQVKHELKELIK